MIYVTYFLLIVFTGFLFYRFKETVVVISAFIGVLGMLRINKNVSLFDALSIISFVILLFKNTTLNRVQQYPFLWGSLIMVMSLACTNLFAARGSHWPSTLVSIFSGLVFPFVLWICLFSGEKSHRKLFVRCTLEFLLAVSIYGLYELISDSNPIIEYAVKHKDVFTDSIGLSNIYRFGVRRLQSFLNLNGALGMTANLGIILLAYLYSKDSYKKTTIHILLVLLIMMSLFTGTRSVFVGSVIAIGYFLYIRKVNLVSVFTVCMLGIVLFALFQQYFNSIIASFTDTESVGGSNSDMRKGQFELAFYFMSTAGIFGNGVGFLGDYVNKFCSDEIFGAESVWLPIMINNGYFGVVSYALFIILPAIYCIREKSKIGLAVILVFISTKTLTSAPGISNYYFLIYLVFYITEKNNLRYAHNKYIKVVLSQLRKKMLSAKIK